MERFMVKHLVGVLAAIAIALSACAYDASYGDCAVHCTADSGCPDELTCGPEGLCRAAEAEVCIVPNDGTGGTITHVGGRTIQTFSASQSGSTFTPPVLSTVEVLVVAGGGGGGTTLGGGGGGAGGLVYVASYSITQPSYVVMVGYGGAPSTNGGNSVFGTLTAIGGGSGQRSSTIAGGSGGGADHFFSGGLGTAGQGNKGGTAGYDSGSQIFTGAGGGGAGGAGGVGVPSAGGTGGPGLAYTISGSATYYAGGGAGGGEDRGNNGLSPGVGGVGGGGNGGLNAAGTDSSDGTGGGGGGGGASLAGGHGGSGLVIISYETSW